MAIKALITVPLWATTEFDNQSEIMIALIVIVYLTHCIKIISFIRPCEVAFLLKLDNFLALLKLLIKEIKEIHKKESLSVTYFIIFLGANNLLF